MIEIYKCVLRPQLLPQFFAGYDVALALKKRQENLEGLLLQLPLFRSSPVRLSTSKGPKRIILG
jgi:hypothetical protein